MITSINYKVVVLCLMVGVVLGLALSGWTGTTAVEAHVNWPWNSPGNPAVGEAVPAAAHLSLWLEEYEILLPYISRDQ